MYHILSFSDKQNNEISVGEQQQISIKAFAIINDVKEKKNIVYISTGSPRKNGYERIRIFVRQGTTRWMNVGLVRQKMSGCTH